MPKMSGLDIAMKVKKKFEKHGVKKPPVLLISCMQNRYLQEKCILEDSIDYYMSKPVSFSKLKQVL